MGIIQGSSVVMEYSNSTQTKKQKVSNVQNPKLCCDVRQVALESFAFKRPAPGEDDVVVDIDFCGVCHSDLHPVRDEWGTSTFLWWLGRERKSQGGMGVGSPHRPYPT